MTIIGVLLSFRGLAQEALLDVGDRLNCVACIVLGQGIFRKFSMNSVSSPGKCVCEKYRYIFVVISLCLCALECCVQSKKNLFLAKHS